MREALKNYKQIKAFLKGTDYEEASIIPISAVHNVNVDALINAILEKYQPHAILESNKLVKNKIKNINYNTIN